MIKLYGALVLVFIVHLSAFGQSKVQTFTRADTLRGMLSSLRICYDINYYHLDIKLNLSEQSISGSNLFRFTANRDFKRLQFDLFDNFEIEKIIWKDQELEFSTEFDAVFVSFPETIKKGSKDEFTVFYSGTPIIADKAPWDGGFIFSKDDQQAPWIAVACQGLGASAWWPCKDHQSDEVDSMMISVTVPRGLQNISNGRLISKEVQTDGSTKFNWFVSYPINNYNVSLNVGDFAHFQDEYQGLNGKLTLDYYVLRSNLEKAKKHFKDVKPMLQCFEHWFGAYPFYKDGYKLIETPYLGMEHQSAIAYGNEYKNAYLGRDLSGTGHGSNWDYIIVHESGHEWFGNNITSKDIADMWIHEAFTTYSESLFVECQKGKAAAAEYVKGERSMITNDRAIIGAYNVNKEGSGDMYAKGANLLHSIRTLIDNDGLWRSILTGLNKEFGLKTVTTLDVVNYINKHSGRDFSKIFDQYLNYKNPPTLELKDISPGVVSYRWKAEAKDFNMPVRIKLPGKSGFTYIYPKSTAKTLKIKGDSNTIKIDEDAFYIKVDIRK